MAPHRPRNSVGFFGARKRPAANYAAEISAGRQRCWLGTFGTRHEAVRAYDAAAWQFGRSRRLLNFPKIPNRETAELLAPPLRLVSVEDERRHARAVQQLRVVEADEHRMAEWRRLHPKDVEYENNYWAEEKGERRAAKAFSDE
ncbi:hypothetical protein ACQ4PT_062113 [Festuca glaucescens]